MFFYKRGTPVACPHTSSASMRHMCVGCWPVAFVFDNSLVQLSKSGPLKPPRFEWSDDCHQTRVSSLAGVEWEGVVAQELATGPASSAVNTRPNQIHFALSNCPPN